MNIEGLVTPKEAAKKLGIPIRFVRNAVRDGRIPSFNPTKGRYYVSVEAVKESCRGMAGHVNGRKPDDQLTFGDTGS